MDVLKRIIYAPDESVCEKDGKIKWNHKIPIQNNDFTKQCKDYVLTHEVTDVIEVSDVEVDALDKLWDPKNVEEQEVTYIDVKTTERVKVGFIPSDIVFANTIPIKDMLIKYETNMRYFNTNEFGPAVASFRVVVFDKYYNSVQEMDDEHDFLVFGVLVTPLDGTSRKFLCVNLAAKRGSDLIAMSEIYLIGVNALETKKFVSDFVISDIIDNASIYLNVWYGIQIALLHPITQEYFSKGRPVKRIESQWESKTKNRKTKYIKRRKILLKDFESSIFESTEDNSSGKKVIVRRTLLWRVIGHWRTYTNSGKKVFIQPYWKGPARNSIEAIKEKEPNEREIAINKEGKKSLPE